MTHIYYYCENCDTQVDPVDVDINDVHKTCGNKTIMRSTLLSNKQLDKYKLDFINEVEQLMEKYSLSISHEDTHGAFIITDYNENKIKWFRQALSSWKNFT